MSLSEERGKIKSYTQTRKHKYKKKNRKERCNQCEVNKRRAIKEGSL